LDAAAAGLPSMTTTFKGDYSQLPDTLSISGGRAFDCLLEIPFFYDGLFGFSSYEQFCKKNGRILKMRAKKARTRLQIASLAATRTTTCG
jgi:hypothetical protein